MDNPVFEGDENIPLMLDDDIPPPPPIGEEGSMAETTFSTPSEETPGSKVIPLSNELKRQKIQVLYHFLGVKGDANLVELDRFRLKKNLKTGNVELDFWNGQDWVSLTNKRTGDFLTESSIRQKIGGVNAMKNMLGLDETPIRSERAVTAARKLVSTIPTDLEMDNISLKDLSRVLVNVEHEVRDVSQNTDLDMREMLGLDKALQRVQGELANNLGKLTSIKEHIEREEQKLKDIETDPSFSEEQKHEVEERLERLKEEHSTRLELVSHNKRNLQSQLARIRQTVEKVLDSDTGLAERIKILFKEQGLTIVSILTALGMTISTIVLAIENALGIGGSTGSSGGGKVPPKDKKGFQAWIKDKLKALGRLLGKLAGKAAAALPGIIGSIVSGILNFLKKAVGFLAEHVWLLILFVAGLVGSWLMNETARKKK